MPLTYSIGDGLTIGVLAYVFMNLIYNLVCKKEEKKKISWVMIILAIIFLIKLFIM